MFQHALHRHRFLSCSVPDDDPAYRLPHIYIEKSQVHCAAASFPLHIALFVSSGIGFIVHFVKQLTAVLRQNPLSERKSLVQKEVCPIDDAVSPPHKPRMQT